MKKRICIFLAFALLLSGCSSISKMRASHHIKAAEKYLLEENYEQAIIALNYSGSVVKTKILDFYNELIWLISNRV